MFILTIAGKEKDGAYSVKDEDNSWDAPVLQENLSKEFDHIDYGVFGPNNKFYYSKCNFS